MQRRRRQRTHKARNGVPVCAQVLDGGAHILGFRGVVAELERAVAVAVACKVKAQGADATPCQLLRYRWEVEAVAV